MNLLQKTSNSKYVHDFLSLLTLTDTGEGVLQTGETPLVDRHAVSLYVNFVILVASWHRTCAHSYRQSTHTHTYRTDRSTRTTRPTVVVEDIAECRRREWVRLLAKLRDLRGMRGTSDSCQIHVRHIHSKAYVWQASVICHVRACIARGTEGRRYATVLIGPEPTGDFWETYLLFGMNSQWTYGSTVMLYITQQFRPTAQHDSWQQQMSNIV